MRENIFFVRLDRFLISTDWTSKFLNTIQKTLPNASSDHCLVMCSSKTKFPCANIFRIKIFWLGQKDFTQMIIAQWHAILYSNKTPRIAP
jgi:hypothetical protein